MEQNPSTQKQQTVPLRNETWRLAWQTHQQVSQPVEQQFMMLN